MVDAIVVSHNASAQAERCSAALAWSDRPPRQIIHVATGAKDVAAEHATNFIRRPDNPGYGQAANAGVAASDAEFVLICNADVFPAPDALGILVDHLQSTPDVACAGPALRNLDGSRQAGAFRFPGVVQAVTDLWPVPNRLRASRLNGRVWGGAAPLEVDHPLGAFLLVRRLAFDIVGGFSPELWMYAEEIDLCRRLQDYGWRVMYVPAAGVWHAGGGSRGPSDGELLAHLYTSRFYWYRTHTPRFTAVSAIAAMRLGLRFRAIWPGDRRAAYARARDAVRRL